ncbi:ribonuclease H-like domain-containing protein [Tanacetum coccineum]
MAIGDPCGSAVPVTINGLDAGNPLHVQNSNNSSSVIIPFKLLGTENYRIWSGAVKLALQATNKYGFVDGSCLKNLMLLVLVYYDNIATIWKLLNETYDKVNGSVVYNLFQKINYVKQGGSLVVNYYHRLNSLWREFDALTKMPKCTYEVKCSCDTSKELGLHRQLMKLMQFLIGLDDCYQPVKRSLLIRDPLPEVKSAYNVVFKEESHREVPESSGVIFFNANANVNVKMNDKPSSSSLSFGFTPEHMQKLLSMINDKSSGSIHANMADIFEQKIIVGHPNGTLATISHVGNLKLTNNVILYDVLVVPGYCVSLLSVNKLIRDRQSNVVMSFHVSKLLWHNRLGHPVDQVLYVLIKDLSISDNTYVPMCEVCQRAKQTREPFPLSDHKSKTLGELVHLDLWGPYRIHSREGYRYFLTIVDGYSRAVWVYLVKIKDETSYSHTLQQNRTVERKHRHLLNVARSLMLPSSVLNGISPFELVYKQKPNLSHLSQFPLSPNDDWMDFSVEDVSLPHSDGHDSTQVPSTSHFSPTQINDDVHTLVLRMSDRQFKLPVMLIDYVLGFNVKYSIEKYVEAMNNEIEALNRNNTWTICEIERYKARRVAKGFSQREGFDYDDTFSLVVKMVTVRCLIDIVVVNNWPLYQLDVNNAFLYGDLVEDQALRHWNAKLTTALAEHGFEQSKFDYSLYTKHRGDKFIALLVYVDDIVITRNDNDGINEFKLFFSTKFLIKDLGILKPRPDISYAVHYLSQHMHNPLQSHFKAALRVLRYLKGSPSCGIQFYKYSNLKLKVYADADWAKYLKTRKFVTGFCVFLGKTLVSWKSKKQVTISKSSSEAEYRFMSSASCKIIWLGNLLHNIGLKNLYPVELCCDNSFAIQIAANPVFHERKKYFELDVHFVREKVLAGIIKTVKVSFDLQTTYVFTKCLGVVQHRLCCKNLSMLDVVAGEHVDKDSGRKKFSRKKQVKAHQPKGGC